MSIATRPCARCGEEIPSARLEALPDTLMCVQCSEEVGGDFTLTVVPESLGKDKSLKKNYGSWRVVKTRRRIVPQPELPLRQPQEEE
jgi:hypothetical protein